MKEWEARANYTLTHSLKPQKKASHGTTAGGTKSDSDTPRIATSLHHTLHLIETRGGQRDLPTNPHFGKALALSAWSLKPRRIKRAPSRRGCALCKVKPTCCALMRLGAHLTTIR
ncbi:hypothetical protein LguiB_009909 [Lonicera macranthoides]